MSFKGPKPEVGFHVFRGRSHRRATRRTSLHSCAGGLAAKAEQAKLDELETAKREAKKAKAKDKSKACKVRRASLTTALRF